MGQSVESWRWTFAFEPWDRPGGARDHLRVLASLGELATSAELDSGQRSAVFDLSAALQAARAGATEIAVVECARDVASLLEDPAQRMRLMLVAGRASVDCFGLDANADAAYFDAAHEASTPGAAAMVRTELAQQHFLAGDTRGALDILPGVIGSLEVLPKPDRLPAPQAFGRNEFTVETALMHLRLTAAALHADVGEFLGAAAHIDRALEVLDCQGPAIDPITTYAVHAAGAVLALEFNDHERSAALRSQCARCRFDHDDLATSFPVLAELELLLRTGDADGARPILDAFEAEFAEFGDDCEAFERIEELGPRLIGADPPEGFGRPNLAARVTFDRVRAIFDRGGFSSEQSFATIARELRALRGLAIDLHDTEVELLDEIRAAAVPIVAEASAPGVDPDAKSPQAARATAQIIDAWGDPPGASAEWWWSAGRRTLELAGDHNLPAQERRAALGRAQEDFRAMSTAVARLPPNVASASPAREALAKAVVGRDLSGRSVLPQGRELR
ncbi:MAG: hypothetical protein ACOYNI_07410 [Acidimicrobiia bacterium]